MLVNNQQPRTFIDKRYIILVSPRLLRFQKKDDDLYNFRCPFCGDSQKNKYKARGYFYAHEKQMHMKCHNCHEALPFSKFLERYDPSLYREYKKDVFKEFGFGAAKFDETAPEQTKYIVSRKTLPIQNAPVEYPKLPMPSINELPHGHFARQYVIDRLIPKEHWGLLYYSSVFSMTIGEIFPDYYDIDRHKTLLDKKEARLVLPYYDKNKTLLGLCGRSFETNAKTRYIVAKKEENSPKIYGMDRVNSTEMTFIVEGPIDSLFLPNAIATMDGNLLADVEYLHTTLVPDNQPRNSGVCRAIKQAIEKGKNVVLWPSDIHEKDINDMVKAGLTTNDLLSIINQRTYSGFAAQFEFSRWQKLQ